MVIRLLRTQLGRFRIIAFMEGLSFLVILFITMPMKYLFSISAPNQVVGMAHGILFVLYVLMVIQLKIEKNWELKLTFLSLLASIIPLGTFYMDHKFFKKMS